MGISSIISNLITVFPRNILTAIPNELFSSFVNCLTHLTCSFGRSAALEEVVSANLMNFKRLTLKVALYNTWLVCLPKDEQICNSLNGLCMCG